MTARQIQTASSFGFNIRVLPRNFSVGRGKE
jgi:hypothetical protein